MVVIRTEGSPRIGWHHLDRCLYLATYLKGEIDCLFCINKDKTAAENIRKKKFEFCLDTDISELEKRNVKAVLFDLDHLGPKDSIFLARIRQAGIKTLQFNYSSTPRQDVDVFIDTLANPDYAMLHHKFRHFNKIEKKYRKNIKNVFINLGDTLDYRTLREIVDLLSRYQYNLKVVPGFRIKKANKKALKKIYPSVSFTGRCESFARAYFEADIAVTAAETAPYEAAAVGTPSLYLCHDRATEAVARYFEKKGTGLRIERFQEDLNRKLKEKLYHFTSASRIRMGSSGKKLIDARGIYRVIDFLKKNDII